MEIYGVALGVVRELGPVMARIERRDPDLARQMRRAATSVVLNIAEGTAARGRNGSARFQTAMGSMRETRACIELSEALGYVDRVDAALLDRIDRVVATLFKLAR